MKQEDFQYFLDNLGKDPSQLVFEDELTGIHNRRFLLQYLQYKIPWRSLDFHPVSLLMADLDNFKHHADFYGRELAEQALLHVAEMIKKIAGPKGLPVRYGSDEFIVLFPEQDKEQTLEAGDQLMALLREKPVMPTDDRDPVSVTVSVGVASAPGDAASGKMLITKASAALSQAKAWGRDCMADAGAITPEAVFTRSALHLVDAGKVAGRKRQLSQIGTAIKKLGQRESQFVVVQGAPGSGKSSFLEAVHRSLDRTRISRVKVAGNPQELFRPFYLAAQMITALLNLQKDRGRAILETLDARETACMAYVLPWLGDSVEDPFEDDAKRRKEIFATLVRFLSRLVDFRPLIVLLDDVHFADEASLHFLRILVQRRQPPILVIGTAFAGQREENALSSPFERFCQIYAQDLNMARVVLTPLAENDIEDYLAGLFPGVYLPPGFCKDIADASGGNPLFISEILPKLVYDRKINRSGAGWVISPLETGYLPRSISEIVREKVVSLGEERQQLLDTASAFGQSVSLSMLAGGSKATETEVLAFIDKAVAQNLVSVDFAINDETIRFLGREIQQVIYQSMETDKRQRLHEDIGNYQEKLYEQHLMPSAAILAYHFQRSANLQKAKNYEQLVTAQSRKLFNSEEAGQYTEDEFGEPFVEKPLDAEGKKRIPSVLRLLCVAARNSRLYPPGSKLTEDSIRQLKDILDEILEPNPRLGIGFEDKKLVVNKKVMDPTEFSPIADAFAQFLSRLDLSAIYFERNLEWDELKRFIEGAGAIDPNTIHPEFWEDFCRDNNLVFMKLRQVRYAKIGDSLPESEFFDTDDQSKPPVDIASSPRVAELTDEEQRIACAVIRSALSAASKLKLYPANGPVATAAIERLVSEITAFFAHKSSISLTHVEGSLLVNGMKMEKPEVEKLTKTFVAFLRAAGLTSLTFVEGVGSSELASFLVASARPMIEGAHTGFWEEFASEGKTPRILFDQDLYGVLFDRSGKKDETRKDPSEEEPIQEDELEDLPDKIRELFLKHQEVEAARLLSGLFADYHTKDIKDRQRVVDLCRTMLEFPDMYPQPRFSTLVLDPFFEIFSLEREAEVLGGMADLLFSSAANMVRVGEHSLSSWVYGYLAKRAHEFSMAASPEDAKLGELLEREPDSAICSLLVEDLKSSDAVRQRKAAQLLGSMGKAAIGVVVRAMMEVPDLRGRQILAGLLTRMGPDAVAFLKRQIALEESPEARRRILEVIDTVTYDVASELAYVLGDENPVVRRAAFDLAQRLQTETTRDLLMEYARNKDVDLAQKAIRSLGNLGDRSGLDVLTSLLLTTKNDAILIAACRALGHIGQAESVYALVEILNKKNFFRFGFRHTSEVRAAAAVSLSLINHPKASMALKTFSADPDPRVREIAKKASMQD